MKKPVCERQSWKAKMRYQRFGKRLAFLLNIKLDEHSYNLSLEGCLSLQIVGLMTRMPTFRRGFKKLVKAFYTILCAPLMSTHIYKLVDGRTLCAHKPNFTLIACIRVVCFETMSNLILFELV